MDKACRAALTPCVGIHFKQCIKAAACIDCFRVRLPVRERECSKNNTLRMSIADRDSFCHLFTISATSCGLLGVVEGRTCAAVVQITSVLMACIYEGVDARVCRLNDIR